MILGTRDEGTDEQSVAGALGTVENPKARAEVSLPRDPFA